MMTRSSLALLFAICFPSIAVAGATINSAGSGYSVTFPVQPKKQSSSEKGVNSTIYVVRDGDNIFASSETLYPEIKDVQSELEADLANYVKGINSKLVSERKADFITSAGTPLPARQFTFEGEKLAGKGIAVASDRCTCVVIVIAGNIKPNGENTPNEKFLSSFKIDK